MAIFTTNSVTALFENSLAQAKGALAKLKVSSRKSSPNFAGLNGWVFEQTIQHCLAKELQALRIGKLEFVEQVSLGGRTKADLLVANVAIEIKAGGLFSMDDVDRYGRYRKAADDKGLGYLFLTLVESYAPFRQGIIAALGQTNAFFLDNPKDWARFVTRIQRAVRESKRR